MATEPTAKPLKPPALPDACNVIDCSTGRQQFWRFAKGKRRMKLVDVRDTLMDQPVPTKHLDRDTSQMWRPHCQNDAWLPAEQVFFRVLQLPLCNEVELPGMVELQLDKISLYRCRRRCGPLSACRCIDRIRSSKRWW